MSTPYGIARTSTIWIQPKASYGGKAQVAADAHRLTAVARPLPTPEYLYEKRAFGIWSLPKGDNAVERKLEQYIDFYTRDSF